VRLGYGDATFAERRLPHHSALPSRFDSDRIPVCEDATYRLWQSERPADSNQGYCIPHTFSLTFLGNLSALLMTNAGSSLNRTLSSMLGGFYWIGASLGMPQMRGVQIWERVTSKPGRNRRNQALKLRTQSLVLWGLLHRLKSCATISEYASVPFA
jgi:hypothetical protein